MGWVAAAIKVEFVVEAVHWVVFKQSVGAFREEEDVGEDYEDPDFNRGKLHAVQM